MICVKCKTQMSDNATFCSVCGERLPLKPEPKEQIEQVVIRQVDPVLLPDDAAKLIKISRWTLDELRKREILPKNCYFVIPSATGNGVKEMVRYKTKELLECDWNTIRSVS